MKITKQLLNDIDKEIRKHIITVQENVNLNDFELVFVSNANFGTDKELLLAAKSVLMNKQVHIIAKKLCFDSLYVSYCINLESKIVRLLAETQWVIDSDCDTVELFGHYLVYYKYDLSDISVNIESLHHIFSNNTIIKSIIMPNDLSKCTRLNHIFYRCTNLEEITFGYVDKRQEIHNVIDLSNMFNGCMNLKSVDLSMLYTENVLDYSFMFCECSNLIELDLDTFDFSKATNFSFMFSQCRKLEKIHGLKNKYYNSINLRNMMAMFAECNNLKDLYLHLNTDNVVDFDSVFKECNSLKELDIGSFTLNDDTYIWDLFYNCLELEYLNIKDMQIRKFITVTPNLFYNCPKLKHIENDSETILFKKYKLGA